MNEERSVVDTGWVVEYIWISKEKGTTTTITTMATAATESPDASRKPIVNFSRPRLASNANDDNTPAVPAKSNVKSVSAFHSPDTNPSDPPLPNEPRFSTDSETLSNTSANARRGDAVAAARRGALIGSLHDQRHPGTRRLESTSTTNTTSSTNSTSRPSTADSLKQLMPIKSILKQTSVEVSSERASSDAGEDTRSHHTVSEDGSGGGSSVGYEKGGKWSSSDHDTSGMSEREVQKLEKKGKNPALVAEMKAARKGKGMVGVMTGMSYVS